MHNRNLDAIGELSQRNGDFGECSIQLRKSLFTSEQDGRLQLSCRVGA